MRHVAVLLDVARAADQRLAADVALSDAVYAARESECTLRQIAAASGLSIEGVRKMIARADRESA